MKNKKKYSILFTLPALFFVSCEVEKTQEGNLPEVDVDVKGDVQVPKYDVDAPDVKVETKTVEVEVPSVEVIPADEDTDDE